ncbi:MAG: peptide-methionine (S)-S-oxide reductase MsrA [Gemmatimonadales bacterium]|nr:peptide-methionine (S)-S-oxide reductase MsrA [Gemmatimonadales bacterium]
MKEEVATLAGGCFWCLEAVFLEIDGVRSVVSGYLGGTVANPTYEQICSGRTGHAEAIRITFDPAVLSYRDLLEVFFAFHDPTTLNRQGPDRGTQYRSAIFPASAEQRRIAEAYLAELTADRTFPDPIVTTIEPDARFYPAEAYHQDYYRRNADQPYCAIQITPKIQKLRQGSRWATRRRA